MNNTNKVALGRALLLALVVSGSAPIARADVSMTNGNSVVTVDPSTQAGMKQWSVDGLNVLNQQWFWIQMGNGLQQSLDTIPLPSIVASSGQLSLTYTLPNLYSVQTTFTLTGGAAGSGTSGMGETISIQNLSGNSSAFHFYQYANFNIPNATVQLSHDITGLKYKEAQLTSGAVTVSEDTGLAPPANEGEAALVPTTLNRLNTVSGLTLNDNMTAGPGNATWAFEWDPTISAGTGTFLISKTLSISGVPEPSTWSLMLLGVAAFGLISRLRNQRS